jgi:hypothetical protein
MAIAFKFGLDKDSLIDVFPSLPWGCSMECGVSGTFRQVKRCSVTLARTSHASTHGSCCFLILLFLSAASTVRQRFRCAPCCHALCLYCASPHGSYLHPAQELHFVTRTKDKCVPRSALVQSARCPCCARLRPHSDTHGRPACGGNSPRAASFGLAVQARNFDSRFV